jgi:A/G-specific adenine glycosylase
VAQQPAIQAKKQTVNGVTFSTSTASFASTLVAWQKQHGRHHLPWHSTDPYRVWISELMLQQTQVSTVLNYYDTFLAAFPTVSDLAATTQDAVYAKWSGLGYYRRARFLHEGAKKIVADFGGVFPTSVADLLSLPGVGQSTAHAIAAFCFHQQVSILDGNVQRTLSRWSGFKEPVDNAMGLKHLWSLAASLVPSNPLDMPTYTQALMDMGATVCTPKNPKCGTCPLQTTCVALASNLVGSIPRKKEKKASPIKHLGFSWHTRRNNTGALEVGFIQYGNQLGIWEHLYGPPTSFSTVAAKADVQVTHVFSHFKGVFHGTLCDDTSSLPLIWKTPDEWLTCGLPSMVRSLLEDRRLLKVKVPEHP